MFWRNWSWPARILSGIFVGLVALIVWPLFTRPRENDGHRFSCTSNLKQIGLGLLQYTIDYNDKFPPVAANGTAYGWADALFPYTKSTRILQCPAEGNDGQTDPHLTGYTDYWFNAQMFGRSRGITKDSATLVMGGDGNDGTDLTNARYSISALPPNWISDAHSPLYRHTGAANYLFVDGHVKQQRVAFLQGTFKP